MIRRNGIRPIYDRARIEGLRTKKGFIPQSPEALNEEPLRCYYQWVGRDRIDNANPQGRERV